ncbi:MAG: YwaF family protein [Eubacteriales bacterium]|nr:YwaF family protein [Eubacteriales bacterium]MDD3881009.1 YwaF family protein [Eubacteriales bacterium]MDD4511922.1 YwaF family protein [Eubacteriales bacterium]
MLCRVYFFVWLSALAFQEWLLLTSGYSAVRYALPLHLCSYCACLGAACMLIPRLRGKLWARRFIAALGMPAALAAMLFPALLPTDFPLASAASFYAVHLLLFFCPLVLRRERAAAFARARLYSALYSLPLVIGAYAVNTIFSANYLFLSALPEQLEFLSFIPQPARPIVLFAVFSALCFMPLPKRILSV